MTWSDQHISGDAAQDFPSSVMIIITCVFREWERFSRTVWSDWLAIRTERVLPLRWRCSCSSSVLVARLSSRSCSSTARTRTSPASSTADCSERHWRSTCMPLRLKPSVLSSISSSSPWPLLMRSAYRAIYISSSSDAKRSDEASRRCDCSPERSVLR